MDNEHENKGGLLQLQEVQPSDNAQHLETEIPQEEVIETQGVDEKEEELELNEEEKYILEMLKKKLEISQKLEQVNMRYEDKQKVREYKKVIDKTENLDGTNLIVY